MDAYELARALNAQAGNATEAALIAKVNGKQAAIDDLNKCMEALELHLAALRVIYGDKLDQMKFTDGTHIVTPIYAALVNGHAAILNAQSK